MILKVMKSQKTMNQMKWRKKARKEIVVITDAPPLTGRKTDYEEEDILKYAKKNKVKLTTLYISW